MAPSGLTLLIVSTLAFLGQAAAECGTAKYGDRNGYPVKLPDVSTSYLIYVLNIPTEQTCWKSKPVGYSVTVCPVPTSAKPIVTVLDSKSVSVQATTITISHVVVYCELPQESNSLPSLVINAVGN